MSSAKKKSLWLVQHHTINAAVEVWLHALFNQALHERKWTASHNACFLNEGTATDTDLTSGWLNPRTYLVILYFDGRASWTILVH
jgi:hypothetical protein